MDLLGRLKELGYKYADFGGVDTHVHFWRKSRIPAVVRPALDLRPDLDADFLPEVHRTRIAPLGMHYFIAVQACDPDDDAVEEATWLSGCSKQDIGLIGIVAGIDLLDSENVGAWIDRLGRCSHVCGVRAIAPENLGAGIYGDPKALETARAILRRRLVLEVLFRSKNPGQLAEVGEFLNRVSHYSIDTPIIVNHLGKPLGLELGRPEKEWLNFLRGLRHNTQVSLKLSALPSVAAPATPTENFMPFYDAALDSLGPQRILFGSDFPVTPDINSAYETFVSWMESRKLGALVNDFMHLNPVRTYNLKTVFI